MKRQISDRETLSIPISLSNHSLISPEYTGVDIEVLFEDDKFLVVNKPFGIHGHPLDYKETNTVLNFLRSKLKGQNFDDFCDKEKGLLYRLDKVTSGVLIFVKSQKDHSIMRENFSSSLKRKEYLAIVSGKLSFDDKVEAYFSSSGRKGERMKVSQAVDGQFGSMKVFPLNYDKDKNLSLIKVNLETGLRHQIRAHLSFLGFPILGDTMYGGHQSERVFLHAYRYSSDNFDFIAKNAFLFSAFFNLDRDF